MWSCGERVKTFTSQDIQGDSRACVGYGFLLEAGTTKRNVKTLLKELDYRRNHLGSLEKLQFSDKRTTVGSRKVLWFEKQRKFFHRFVLIIFL